MRYVFLVCMAFGALAVAPCRAAAAEEPAKASPATPAKDGEPVTEEKKLGKLPEKDLPPLTRRKPDPDRDQFQRFSVHVKVTETLQASKGQVGPAAVPVVENYLSEYFRRAGHPVTSTPKGATYVVEGSVEVLFHSTLTLLESTIGWKYHGGGAVEVKDFTGKVIEKFEVPELHEESGRSEEIACLDFERHMAKLLWDNLLQQSQVFTNTEARDLIGSLSSQGATRATSGSKDPSDEIDDRLLTTEDVVRRLADIGFPAVPYLLEALDDERVVLIPSDYPGLRGNDPSKLRAFHVADKALEEVFQKVSRMSLDIGTTTSEDIKLRRVILKGWEAEWRRFCKPYRESPKAKK